MLEVFEEYVDLTTTFESANDKTNMFLQLTLNELATNKEAAELKVLQESGTESDLQYLYTEAENGAIQNIKNALKAAITAFVNFIKNLKTKVIKMITSSKTDLVLSKVQKKLKLNPFLAKKKVQVIDKSKPLKIINTYRAKADRHIAKVKAGVFKQKEITSITTDIDSFDSAYKASVAGAAALVTMTAAQVIAAVKAESHALPDHIDKVDKETTEIMEKLISSLDNKEEEISVRAAYTAIANFRTKLGEKEASEHVDSILYKLKVLRKDVLRVSDAPEKTPVKPTKESAGEEDDNLEDFLGESGEYGEGGQINIYGESEEDVDSIFDGFLEESGEEDGDPIYEYTAEDLLEDLNGLYED